LLPILDPGAGSRMRRVSGNSASLASGVTGEISLRSVRKWQQGAKELPKNGRYFVNQVLTLYPQRAGKSPPIFAGAHKLGCKTDRPKSLSSYRPSESGPPRTLIFCSP
jgi:hypothetical protein